MPAEGTILEPAGVRLLVVGLRFEAGSWGLVAGTSGVIAGLVLA